MQRSALLIAVLSLAAATASAQTSTWVPDKAHSEVDFSILHMSLTKVHGRFGNLGGSIVLDESDVTKSTVKVTIDVSSVDTGVTARDNDLKSTNFFDVARFPTATFESTSVTKSDSGFTVAGNLTVHGVTKPVVLQVDGPTGPITSMDHKTHAGYSATTTVDRIAFGLGMKYPAAMLGNKVALSIDFDAVKQ